jgi:V/A-type H+/Na+-transporting ATPase subunit E
MEIQLQELLDRIKREGVDAAKVEVERLLAEGEAQKKAIVQAAEREAAAIVEKARGDAKRAEESGKAALAQASRDLLLAFRDRLQSLLQKLVQADTTSSFGPEVLAEAIPAVLKALSAGGAEELSVLLPPAMLKKLEARFTSLLAAQLKGGLEIKPSDDVAVGFRISEKNGAAYYDFSGEAVAELLSRHVNARLADTLRDAARGL